MSISIWTRASLKDMVDSYHASKSYYADLITGTFPTDPTAVSTRANLTLATGGNYAPVALGSPVTATNGQGAIIDANDPTWTGLFTNGTAISGMAVLVGNAGSPSSSDRVIAVIRRVVAVTVASVTTTNNSATITSSAAFGSITNDMTLEGTGIPTGAFVLDKVDNSTIRMSAKATASGTITLTFYQGSDYTPGTTSGTAQNFSFTLPSTGFIKLG